MDKQQFSAMFAVIGVMIFAYYKYELNKPSSAEPKIIKIFIAEKKDNEAAKG